MSASSTHSAAPVGLDPDDLDGIVGRALRPEPEAHRLEVGLEDRFEDQLGGRHDHPVSHGGDAQRPGLARLARLGNVHPPQRLRPVRPGPHRGGEPVEEVAHPGGLDGVDGHPIDAGSPPVGAHVDPRPPHHVAAGDMVVEGVEATCWDLAWHCGRARVASARTLSTPSAWLTDLADRSALIRVPRFLRHASMKQGPFALAGLCCPGRRHYYDPLRLPLDCRPLPGITGYRQARSPGRRPGAEEALSSSHDNLLTVPRPPTPEGSSPPAPGSQAASMAFALPSRARHPLGPPHGGFGDDARRLRFMLRTGQSLAPSQGLRRSASTTASLPPPGAVLPGTLASPRTGLTPAGCRELVARLRHHDLLRRHGARAAGRTMEPEPALVVRRRLLPCSPSASRPATRRCPTPPGHAGGAAPTPPHAPRPRVPQRVEHVAVDGVEGPPDRRVRRHRPEQLRLITQRRHVRHTPATGGQHHRHLHQHLATIMHRGPFTAPRHGGRIGRRQPDPISEFAEHVSTDQLRRRPGRRRSPAPAQPCCSVHLASALQVRVPTCRQRQNPLSGGHFRGWATLSSPNPVNDRG